MKYVDAKFFRFVKMPVLLICCIGMAIMGCATDKGSQSSNQDSPQMDVPRQITGIHVEKVSDADVVYIQGNTVLSYTSIKQPSPLKIILFFPETEIGDTVQTVPSDPIGIIGDVSASRVGGVQTGKVEIGLKQDVSYLVEREGNSLKVSFAGKSTETAALKATDSIEETPLSEASLPSSTDAGFANDKKISRTYPVTPTKADAKKSPGGAWVNRIDFSSEKKGKSTVIIGTTKPVEYRMDKLSPTALQLKLVRTNISDFRKLPLITTRFESALDRIRPLQTNAMKSDSVIAMDLRESVPYFVEQEGNVIKIHFEASSIPPRPDAPLATTFVEKVEEKPVARIEEATTSKRERGSDIPPDSKAVPAETRRSGVYRNDVSKVYSGEKMGIDFFDTDIRNVFRLLADYSGENFAIDKDVQGKVTLAFEKPVPWDQVLDLVLKMNQLDKVQDGGIIRIARLKTLEEEEKSKQQLFEAEKKAKEQSLELEPVMTEYIPVNYAKAQDEMKQHVEGLVTKRPDCSISVDDRTNQLIITDTAAKLQHIRSIVQKLDRVTPQVVIEAKIVEATTDFSRELGFKLDAQWGIQNTDANAGVGPQPGYDTLGGTHGGTTSYNFPPLTQSNYGKFGFNFMRLAGTPIMIDAQLMAMEANKNGKIISAPKILTLDNKEANIEQGLEVGYMEKGKTDEAPTTKFKKVVLHLKVVPHITLDNRIAMKIEILKDDVVNYTSTGVPTIATKKALTELLVDDGDTLVIGGITKSSEAIQDEGIPYLAKIPLLGYLFGTKSNTKKMEELLIFMTPRIVQLEQRAESGTFTKN